MVVAGKIRFLFVFPILLSIAGVYIFHFSGGQKCELLVGWRKNILFVKKKRKYEGEEVEKWAKSGKFSKYLGEKYHFEMGGGDIVSLTNIHPCINISKMSSLFLGMGHV